MPQIITTTVEVNASPDTVWGILTDLAAYEEWNPFIVASEGTPAVGERLTNRMHPPGGRAMTFRPTVTESTPGIAFEWLGRLGIPGLFDGRHRFELEATASGTRLTHSETFTGILVPLMKRFNETKTRTGFEAMNEALKARAEAAGR